MVNAAHFFKRRDTQHTFMTLADLAGLNVGVVQGYAYGESFYKPSIFRWVSNGAVLENLRSLLSGELDLVLADLRVALYELNLNIPAGIPQVALLEIPYATKGLRIGVSKQHPDHVKIIGDFNAAIAVMKEDGSYADVLASHRLSAVQ